MKTHKDENIKICLLGASFDTGNMGVSALAVSTVQCIAETLPNAQIFVLDYGEGDGVRKVQLVDKTVRLEVIRASFSKRIWGSNHYLRHFSLAVLYRLLPLSTLRGKILKKSKYLRTIMDSDACLDISAGDSFSDIYGLYRLFYISSYKLLVLLMQKKLFLLPQTYGPFKKVIARIAAAGLLRRAAVVYSRDRSGVGYVRSLLKNADLNGKVRFAPDVAFVLEPRKPDRIDVGSLENVRKKDSTVIGLNISGLLYNGGYTRDNMFGLKSDYCELLCDTIRMFLEDRKALVLLVPHVFHPPGNVESDSEACMQVYDALKEQFKGRLFLTRGRYDQSEIKYVIGLCDFFVGSRMHSCIAAMSQSIPTVGLAYSKKFRGVFETVGADDSVIDMRCSGRDDILAGVGAAYEGRKSTAEHLRREIPKVQREVLSIFKSLA